MRLSDFLYEAKKPEIVKIDVTPAVAVKEAEEIYDSDEKLKRFLSRIHRPKLSDDRSGSFIYRVEEKDGEDKIRRGETVIRFNEEQSKQPSEVFAKIIKSIKDPKPTEWEGILKKATESLGDASQQDFILTFFIPKVSNPGVKPKSEVLRSITDLPNRYEIFGKAMVFRAGKCVSRLTDVNTKINKENFQDIMQKCFGAATDSQGESDTFLSQFVRLKEKMQIDAAKYTIYVIAKNGDIGNDDFEESYYDSIRSLLPMIMEAEEENKEKDFIELPTKVADFVNNDARKALIQASNVAKKYPRQYNICYKKLENAFENGVKEQQELERKDSLEEYKDPVTGKIVKRHGKAWGTGGPNGFIRDNELLDKLCKDIKGQPWTMFNCVGKTVLKIFDAIETGGKIYQKLCDDMAEGYKEIMHSFGTTRGDDFGKLADQYSKDGKQNHAMSADMAGIVFGISKIYRLLGEGKIGTINGKYKTVTTINKDNTTIIQAAINELLNSIARFTKKEPEYNRWKEERQKEIDAKIKKYEETIKKLESGRATENQNNESTKTYVNMPASTTIKQLINEEQENKKQASIKEEIEKQKNELESLKKKRSSKVQVTLENYFVLLDEYNKAAGHIGEIADIHSFLVKMFDENEAKDQYAKMFNKKGSEEEDGSDEEDLNDSLKLNIKNPFINEDIEIEDGEDKDGDDGDEKEENNDRSSEATSEGKGKEGNLDWIETKAGKNLVELYRQFGVNIQNTKLDISSLKRMAKEKSQKDTIKNFATIVKSINESLSRMEINPITDGIIAFDYAFGEDADESKFTTLANAFKLEGFKSEDEAREKDEKAKEERRNDGVFTIKELETEMNNLGKMLSPDSKAMKTVKELNGFANSAENDNWVTDYGNKIKEAEAFEKEIWDKCFEIYNDKNKNTRKGNEWLKQKQKEANGQVYLNKLWITLSTAKYIVEQIQKKVEAAKKKNESFITMNKFILPLLTEDEDAEQSKSEEKDGTKKRHTVETAINTYTDNLSKLNFNDLVPTDIKDEKFNIFKGKEFNAMETKIAEGRLGTRAENNSNLPKSVLKNVIGNPTDENNKIYKALSSTCKRMMDYIIYGSKSKDLKGDDRDIYLLAGCMIGVCKSMQKLRNTPEGQEDHRDKSTAHPQKGPEGEKVEAGTPKTQNASYIDTRSKDSLINEIYKYIRG